MLKYFITRLLLVIPMVLVISFLIFFALELTPGDAATSILSPEMRASVSEADMAALIESLGLNDPFLVRYFRWLGRLLQGNLGYSLVTGSPINDIIKNLLPATISWRCRPCCFPPYLGFFSGSAPQLNRIPG